MADVELTEAQMRRALGLDSLAAPLLGTVGRTDAAQPDIPPRTKPSFSSQGSVWLGSAPSRSEPPSPLRQRLAALERQLVEERAHHDQSRRQLEGAQRALAELQARTQRIALDHADALAVEHAATMRAQRELDDLLFECDRLGREASPATTAASATPRPEPVAPAPQPSASPAVADPPARPSRGRPRVHATPEPKPVRWWTASYRAGSRNKR